MQLPNGWRWRRWLALLLLLVTLSGCQSATRRRKWIPPLVSTPDALLARAQVHGSAISTATAAYTSAYEREHAGYEDCVDSYYLAATLAWSGMVREPGFGNGQISLAAELYRSALIKLIVTGQHFGRLNPKHGLTVQTQQGWQMVPAVSHGYPWPTEYFDVLVPVGEYHNRRLNHTYSSPGLGVATVALCRRSHEPFRKEQQFFSATVVLRPTMPCDGLVNSSFTLEFIDSLRVSHVQVGHRAVPLRRDITAPFAYRLKDENRNYINAFLQPGSSASNSGLFMIEPYQPGKIPVVFVHGLLSDPFTWANLANEIRAQPDLMQKYQIWGFEYATGEPFLASAAMLRRHLREVRATVDPSAVDPAITRMILIGHSMGGLVAKLQITCSGDALWRSVSPYPFVNVRMTQETRRVLTESFFFEPSRLVSRVVYMGTPHRGSPWARRPIGKLGSSLVEEPSSMENHHDQLVNDNPNSFSAEFTRRVPTSIDLLRPDSPLLQAIDRLPVAGHVRQHSVIGLFRPMLGAGDSDGVVPVASAVHPGDLSEKRVIAKHQKIHQSEDGIGELLRILREHAMACGR